MNNSTQRHESYRFINEKIIWQNEHGVDSDHEVEIEKPNYLKAQLD